MMTNEEIREMKREALVEAIDQLIDAKIKYERDRADASHEWFPLDTPVVAAKEHLLHTLRDTE